MASSRCNILERREKASEEGNSSPYVPPEIQEGSSSLHLQNSRRKASLPSRRGGVSKSSWSVHQYWAVQKDLVKGCRETLDCYCVSCELLSASIADTLLFVNILVSGIFHGRFAQRLAVNKPCLQIIRRLLWKRSLFTANR